jgi:nucleotide-binding universal stress UspA family protein
MRVLIAIDESEYSQGAVQSVLDLFDPKTTKIRLLTVLVPTFHSIPPQMSRFYEPELEQRKKEARTVLDCYSEKLRSAGFDIDTALENGEARSTIIDSATQWGADLIVVGSHGHKGWERLLLGSVAESVVRHATCSVLVVRHHH